jgi:hypothetical protein
MAVCASNQREQRLGICVDHVWSIGNCQASRTSDICRFRLGPSTLRTAPAMEAGISDHVWSIEEIVGLLEK